jgi:hypothetical protein
MRNSPETRGNSKNKAAGASQSNPIRRAANPAASEAVVRVASLADSLIRAEALVVSLAGNPISRADSLIRTISD